MIRIIELWGLYFGKLPGLGTQRAVHSLIEEPIC